MPDHEPLALDRRTVLAAMGGLFVAAVGAPSAAGASTARVPSAAPNVWRLPTTRDRAGLTQWSDDYGGKWLGAWADDAGRTGTSEFDLTISAAKRTARVAFAASGALFGSKPLPRETVNVQFTPSDRIIESFSGTVPDLGFVRCERQNTWGVVVVTTSPPKSSKRPQSRWYANLHDTTLWTIGYTLTAVGGDETRGSAAWSRDARPRPPSPTAYSTGAGFDGAYVTGGYASKLLDAATLRQALGSDVGKPEDNGGTASFTPTMGSSNSRVASAAYLLQFSVLRGKTEADAQGYFADHFSSYEPVAELAPDATFGIGKLWVRRGREIAEIEVTANQGGAGDTAGARAAAIQLGQSIAPKLDKF